MSSINNEQLAEFISNSQIAFLNGRYQEAFSLAKSAIKLDVLMHKLMQYQKRRMTSTKNIPI